jgi:hypothetical protein
MSRVRLIKQIDEYWEVESVHLQYEALPDVICDILSFWQHFQTNTVRFPKTSFGHPRPLVFAVQVGTIE